MASLLWQCILPIFLIFVTLSPAVVKCLPRVYKDGQSRNTGYGEPFYPITASWFRDRFTKDEWLTTLTLFQSIGGDTVVSRAPDMVIRTADDIRSDPNFHWCGSSTSPAGLGPPDCVTEAQDDLKKKGLNVSGFATYQYEEGFSEKVMCGELDKKINSSRVYYRLVLPVTNVSLGSCDFKQGDEVIVVFTSYAGTDPHDVLIEAAKQIGNMSVYFGLPGAPKSTSSELLTTYMEAYYQLVYRVLRDHSFRYTSLPDRRSQGTDTRLMFHNDAVNQEIAEGRKDHFEEEIEIEDLGMLQKEPKEASSKVKPPLIGYYGTDEACLAELTNENSYLQLYKKLGSITKMFSKQFMVSPYIILNRSQKNYTMQSHADGFTALAKTGVIDIIAVQEGRGSAKGCYYFENQIDMSIAKVDPGLDKIVRYLDPTVPNGATYRQQFTGSNNQLFRMFGDARDKLQQESVKFEFWLNVEAFEYLRDDPCLPVDSRGSGMSELLDRTNKSRLDWALSVAGIYPNKVISFAWDSDFTCNSRTHQQSLAMDIYKDWGRPIIMNCSWHSPGNMSVVLIGHYILGDITQGYQVEYQIREGTTQKDFAMPYYVEGDWGPANNRIPSLVYTQLYNVRDPFDISRNGTVTISAQNVYHPCVFTYDYR